MGSISEIEALKFTSRCSVRPHPWNTRSGHRSSSSHNEAEAAQLRGIRSSLLMEK